MKPSTILIIGATDGIGKQTALQQAKPLPQAYDAAARKKLKTMILELTRLSDT